MDFGSYVIGLFLYENFWKIRFWLVLKLEINYRVMISWRILVSLWGFYFLRLYFRMVKYLNFHNYSFALRYFLKVNGKATQCDTPLVFNTKLVVPNMKVLTPFLHTNWYWYQHIYIGIIPFSIPIGYWYHHWHSLAQWFYDPSVLGWWTFHKLLARCVCRWKEGGLNSHKGWLCLVFWSL